MLVETSTVNKFDVLKRRIYLAIIPILLVTNLFYWLVSPNINRFMEITIPPTCLLLGVLWVCLFKRVFVHYLEVFCVLLVSIYYLIRIHTMMSELTQGHLNIYMFWSPIYYIFIFMVLERKKALYLSSAVLFITVFISLPMVDNVRVQDIIVQYCLSTIIYILILFYFKQVVTAYIESDIHIKNAYYDHLTNIGNRRSIDYWLEREIDHAANKNMPFSIIYFDIDHFKKVNDVYGHEVGDHILKEIAVLITTKLQPNDYFGRWGGEEFIILCAGRSLDETVALANLLRQTVEEHSFQHVEHLTSSFGVATYQSNDSVKTIVKRADEALYFAKNNGRNLVASSSLDLVALGANNSSYEI